MNTEAIVDTAGETPYVGDGCDIAIYSAAGFEKLSKAREEIGNVPEGDVFITPGFELSAKYIIHAVSPYYIDGKSGEEEKLRSCYRKSLALAKENDIKSISFPLIATGSYGYPRAHGLRIAVDEINTFLLENEMDIYLVVFDSASTELAEKIYPQIEAFIKHDDVCRIREEEYGDAHFNSIRPDDSRYDAYKNRYSELDERLYRENAEETGDEELFDEAEIDLDILKKKLLHIKDPFGVYVHYLVERESKNLTELENTAWLSKTVVYNIRKKPKTYRPDKRTAFQLCVGLELNIEDSKDLLSRAGYAFSPSSGEDKIWETYIENEHYDIIDISDTLEHFGFKPIVDF